MATDIGNVYLDVYADTKALKRQIRTAAKAAGKDFGKEFSKEFSKEFAKHKVKIDESSKRQINKDGNSIGRAFRRAFDGGGKGTGSGIFSDLNSRWREFTQVFSAGGTVLLRYFPLIIGQVSVLASAIGGVLTASVGSLYTAIIGLGAAGGGVFAALAYSVALASKSFDEFKNKFPATQTAIESLKDAFLKVDVPTFAAEWSGSVERFATTLSESLRGDTIAEELGKATAGITDAFTAVLQSPAWTGFVDAIEGPLANAMEGIGTGLAGLFGVALQWMTAAAPLAERLGQQFSDWGTSLNEALGTTEGQAGLTKTIAIASDALDAILPLITNVGGALNGLFMAGASTGTGMLDTLGKLAATFNQWVGSIEGQNALAEWFSSSQAIFNALLPLLGAVGTMLADLVTPATIASLISFMDTLVPIIPIIGNLIGALQQVGLLDVLGQVLTIVARAIEPLLPAIAQLAALIGDSLGTILTAVTPLFATLAQVIAPIISLLLTLVPIFANLASTVLPALQPIIQAVVILFTALAPIVAQLAEKFSGLLIKAVKILVPVITALLPVILSLVDAFLPIIDIVFDVVDVLIEALAPVLKALMPIISTLAPTIIQLVIAFVPVLRIITLLAPLIKVLAQPLSALIVLILNLIAPVIDAIEPFLTFFATLFAGKKAIKSITDGLQTFGGKVIDAVGKVSGIFTKVGEGIAGFATKFTGFFSTILTKASEFITKIVTFGENIVMGLLSGLTSAWTSVTLWFSGVIDDLINFVKGLFGIHSPSTVFADFGKMILQGLLDGLTSLVGMITTFFTTLFSTLTKLVVDFITAYITFWFELPGKIIDALKPLITKVGTWITSVWNKIVSVGTSMITKVISFYTALPGKIIAAVASLVGKIATWMASVWAKMKSAAETGWGAVRSFFTGLPGKVIDAVNSLLTKITSFGKSVMESLLSGFTTGWTAVSSWVGSIGDKVVGLVGTGLSLLTDAGYNIISGFLSGLKSAWENVKSFVGGIGSWIADHKGPAAYDKRLLVPAGGWIMEGLRTGMESEMPALLGTLNTIADGVVSTVKGNLGIASPSTKFIAIGKDVIKGLSIGLVEGIPDLKTALQKVNDAINKGQEDAIKVRAKQIMESRRQENAAIKKSNAPFVKEAKRLRTAAAKESASAAALTAKAAKSGKEQAKKLRAQAAQDRADASALRAKAAKQDAKKTALKDSISSDAATKKAIKQLKAQNKKINDAQQTLKKQQVRTAGVTAKTIRDGFKRDADGNAKVYASGAKKGMAILKKGVDLQKLTLADLANSRADLAKRIETANANLADAIKAREDFRKSITDSSIAFASALKATAKEGEALTATDVVTQMRDKLKQLQVFKANVEALRKSGLNDATLQEIVAAGVEGGGATAAALAAGGKDAVGAVNDLQAQVNGAAKGLGDESAKWFYQAGVDTATGIVNGLNAEMKTVTAAYKKVGEEALKAFNKAAGVASPSKKFATSAQFMMKGVSLGLKRGQAGVLKTVSGVSSRVTNAFQPTLTARAGVSSLGVNPTRGFGNAGTLGAARGGTTVESGAIQIVTPVKDPGIVASMVLDNLVARAR